MSVTRRRIWVYLDEAQPREAAALKTWRVIQGTFAETLRASILRDIVVAGLEKISDDLASAGGDAGLRRLVTLAESDHAGASADDLAPRRRGRPPIKGHGRQNGDVAAPPAAPPARKRAAPTPGAAGVDSRPPINPPYGEQPIAPPAVTPPESVGGGAADSRPRETEKPVEQKPMEPRPRLGLSMW